MAEVFVPLNRFQSVISNLTGEEDEVYKTPVGVSTIMLSAQITNTGVTNNPLTVLINSNREIPVANFDGIEVTGSFVTASALLDLNKQFIVTETYAFMQFQNNLLEDPLPISASFYQPQIQRNAEAVSFDISNNTTIRTTKAARSYYDKNGTSLILSGQLSASLQSVDYANLLSQQVLKNEHVTGSAFITRLYQNIVTQSFNFDLTAESGSIELVEDLYNVIVNNINNPIREPQPIIELIKNVEIPRQDSLSPVVAGKLVLEEGYGLIFSGSTDLTVILSLLESANE
jgi:hypothetical protein